MTCYTGKREQLIMKRRMSLKPQVAVAMELGISQAAYSNIENGYANPSPDVACKLIDMFDLPNDFFDTEVKETD